MSPVTGRKDWTFCSSGSYSFPFLSFNRPLQFLLLPPRLPPAPEPPAREGHTSVTIIMLDKVTPQFWINDTRYQNSSRLRGLISSAVFLFQRLPSPHSTQLHLPSLRRLTSATSKTWARKETSEPCWQDSLDPSGRRRSKFSSQPLHRKAFTPC